MDHHYPTNPSFQQEGPTSSSNPHNYSGTFEEDPGAGVRRRRADADVGGEGVGMEHSNAGLYQELERLRSLVEVIEGKGPKRSSGSFGGSCFPVALDNSVMSTVFGFIFITIMTVTFYAFYNLGRAVYKRFFIDPETIV